jgi:tRNA pseudouridine38-40 synthase
MRVRGLLEYLGTSWAGWQLQPGQPTIQGELERALSIVLNQDVRVAASGRTDAGVHATGQVIAFDVPDGRDLPRLCRSINALTDASICVVDLRETNAAFDPRRHALSRTYEYTIVNDRPPSPFLVDRSWHVHQRLDVARLSRLAGMITGEHDFTAFRAADCASNSTRRFVTESAWRQDANVLTYRISANAFLKQMVRTLVGTMVDVDLGRLEENVFAAQLEGGTMRTLSGRTAPAEGLALVRVDYPPEFEDDAP